MNDQEGSKKEEVTWNVFLHYLGLDAYYKCFVFFIFDILLSSCISAMLFISVL